MLNPLLQAQTTSPEPPIIRTAIWCGRLTVAFVAATAKPPPAERFATTRQPEASATPLATVSATAAATMAMTSLDLRMKSPMSVVRWIRLL